MTFINLFYTVSLALSVLAKDDFITKTNIQTVIARDTSTCDPSPSGGLPPICVSDLGTFDPDLFEYASNISTTQDTITYASTTEAPTYYSQNITSLSNSTVSQNTSSISNSTSHVQTTKTSSATLSAAATSSVSAPKETPPPCYVFEDPDSGMKGGVCMCSNGHTIPLSPSTNAGGTVVDCPWPTIPPQALTTSTTSKNDKQYQFTYTDLSDHKVIECETFAVSHYGGIAASFCEGSTALLYEPPMATMEMGNSKVNVGSSMTGAALFTSVSNALSSLCPTPTSDGAWTSCSTGSVKVGAAAYLEDGMPKEGDVNLHVPDAQYNSTNYLQLFINMIAGAANATATGLNCKPINWSWLEPTENFGGGESMPITHKGIDTFCNINNFLDAQWYDGVKENAQMWFETEFGFQLSELGNFDCSSTVDVVALVVGLIFDAILPEFAWLISAGVELGVMACQAAETFNPTKSKREIEDDRLAKAWKKEMKKDRKLPMPELKKRELGLLEDLQLYG